MLIFNILNKTGHNYDVVRSAAKAAFKNSAAFRQRQVTFDDSRKSESIMGIRIGDRQTTDLVMNVELTSINMLTQTVTPFENDRKDGKLVAAADPEPVNEASDDPKANEANSTTPNETADANA